MGVRAWALVLTSLPGAALLTLLAEPAPAQSVTERETYVPVVQVSNSVDSRSLQFSGLADTLSKVLVGINFTKCDDPISPSGVCLGLNAPFYDEFGFRLRGPDGTTVTLVQPSVTFSEGGRPGNTFSFVFDDDAPLPVSAAQSGATLVSGTYRPQSSLAAFNGLPGNGEWTLLFQDQGVQDPLSLNSWFVTLIPRGSSPSASTTSPLITGLFTGQTLKITAPLITTQTFKLTNVASNAIDLNGLKSLFAGVFSGPGSITFLNSGSGGKLLLNAFNTYTGSTTVQAGAHLAVNGSIASSSGLTVDPGAVLSGNGLLPKTSLLPGSVIAPGASIGQLTVNGDLSLNGAALQLEIQGPQVDSIQVSGNVTAFSGTAQLIPYNGGTALPGFTYVSLNAPSSTPFAAAGSLNLDASLINAGSVVLSQGTTLIQNSNGNPRQLAYEFRPRRNGGAVFAALEAIGAGSGNSLRSAAYFDRAFPRLAAASASNGNASGAPIGVSGFSSGQAAAAGLSTGFVQSAANLLTLSQPAQLAAAMQTVAPENYASFQAVGLNALRLQRDTLLSQADTCSLSGWVLPGGDGRPARRPLCVYALGGNATATVGGSNGLFSYDSAIAAGLYGVEWRPSSAWTVGAAYGYGTANLSNLGPTQASVASNIGSGSLYGVFRPASNLAVKGLLGYGRFNLEGSRSVAAIGSGSAITGSTIADGVTTALTAELDLPLNGNAQTPSIWLRPMVGIGYSAYQQLGFQEAGVDSLLLQVDGHTAQSLTGTLGAELSSRIPLDAAAVSALIPRLKLAYQVDALANNTANTSLSATMPSTGIAATTFGQNFGPSELLIAGSVELQLARRASLFAAVNYQVYDNGSQFAYGGGVRYSF